MTKWIWVLFLVCGIDASGQVPSKVNKLVGTWEYKEGSGFESWEKRGNELVGHEFRVNQKTGDTSKVVDMAIRKPGKTLIYKMDNYKLVENVLVVNTLNFVGEKRKLKFFNTNSQTPYAIEYAFGFLNKNHLKVLIYYGPFDKPLKLTLNRVKN